MEFIVLLRYICMSLSVHLVVANDSYSEWLSMTRRAEEREKTAQNDWDEPGRDLITAEEPKSCCKNGGICIMNSFCHCKKQFYGRYCQHRVKHRSCGTIAHGTWLTAACNMCHCYDGQMICKTADFPNCDDTFQDGVEKEPEYSGGIEKAFEDYDKFYDDYEPESSSRAASRDLQLSVMLVFLSCLGLVS